MIDVDEIIIFLKNNKIDFYTGVPDSILKKLSSRIDNMNLKNHIISNNEGSAIALGAGYYLSKKKLPVIYMQNSGLGNAINPLISLAHKKVYSIPMLLIIGWRGASGTKDEPQHLEKGKITKDLLKLLNIKSLVLKKKVDFKKLKKLLSFAKKESTPVACLIKKDTFKLSKYSKKLIKEETYPKGLERSSVIKKILNKIKKNTDLISTTGFTSRELYQIRSDYKIKNGKDFYMVGAMGHAAMLAFGNSFFKKDNTICLDGDGSALMHMGSLAILGNHGKKNFKYILFNNGSHESVGGQKTIASKINFEKISKGFNFKRFFISSSEKNLEKNLSRFLKLDGPSFFEIKIKNKSMKNLIRPKNLLTVKKNFLHD